MLNSFKGMKMFDINYNEKDSVAVLKFNAPLTVQIIVEIKNALIAAAAKANKIIIDHQAVEDFDISYVQLLIAARNSFKPSGKKLIVKVSENNSFRKFLEDSGCSNLYFLFEEADEKLEIR